jgi:phosphopantetheinyl transferase
MAHVLVLHSSLADGCDPARAARLLACLPYGRRLALERRDPAARTASLAGTALVLAGAARLIGAPVEPARLEFREGSAPMLPGGPWFSVSHSATRVAVALSGDCRLGLDIEEEAARSAAAATFAGTLQRWTAIEAALKAAGAGIEAARDVRLAADLSGAEVGGFALRLQALDLGPGCTASLATPVAVERVTVEPVAEPW